MPLIELMLAAPSRSPATRRATWRRLLGIVIDGLKAGWRAPDELTAAPLDQVRAHPGDGSFGTLTPFKIA